MKNVQALLIIAGLGLISTVASAQFQTKMESAGARVGPSGQLIVIMTGRTAVNPKQVTAQTDGSYKSEYVVGGSLVDRTLPDTNTRVTLMPGSRKIPNPKDKTKKISIPILLGVTAESDEKIEYLQAAPGQLTPLIFAPGAEILVFVELNLGEYTIETFGDKDSPFVIKLDRTRTGFSVVSGSGRVSKGGIEVPAGSSAKLAGPNSATVFSAQKKLSEFGYDPGPVDGIWGSKTKAALLQFQHDRQLEMSGSLDSPTLEALLSKP